jgi:Pumilio-family RNA binding repeat
VIQHLLEHGAANEKQHITDAVIQSVYDMSIDQYSSKVVEKCIKVASKKDLCALINEVIQVSAERK